MMMPYQTRLYWAGGRGFASLRGEWRRLTLAPLLDGERVHAIDYVPLGETSIAQVQVRACDPPRDLSADEVEKVMSFLEKMCGASPA